MPSNALVWLVLVGIGALLYFAVIQPAISEKITVVPCVQFDEAGKCVKAFRFENIEPVYHERPFARWYITSSENISVMTVVMDNYDFRTWRTEELKAGETIYVEFSPSFWNGVTIFGLLDTECHGIGGWFIRDARNMTNDEIRSYNNCFVYLAQFDRDGNVVG